MRRGLVHGRCTAEHEERPGPSSLRGLVEQIREEIGNDNRVRHEMNGALISIGLRDGNLRRSVLTIARRIGPVQVDHGETGCKTPDIVPYIERTLARREAKAARQAERAQAKAAASA